MFYPEESLRKGGRFYLCWVADSWPLCFATISHRQLWSQDIRKICDDLLEVMNNESGRPASRFSLRLSSQLMRGVVRLYQRKVIIMLGDLCMINARVMKSSNRKFNIHEPVEDIERQLFPVLDLPAVVQGPVPANEERVEELLQQSANVVSNIQDITLKEAAIPDLLLPPNDGFGEENPNQAIEAIQAIQPPDRTLELMLGASSSAVHSGLDLPQDKSAAQDIACEHLVVEPQMERISEHDVTMFRKSTAQDILPMEFEKDIPIPELPPPEVVAPVEKEPVVPEPEIVPVPAPMEEPLVEVQRAAPAQEEIELEELGELEPQVKRRRKQKLIVDKKTILPSSFLRPRIENIAVELRCEDSTEDIADLRVPCDVLFGRPAAAGARIHSTLGLPLARLFAKNLGFFGAGPLGQREMELALASSRPAVAPTLAVIPEEPQPIPEPQTIEPPQQDVPMLDQSIAVPGLGVSVVEDIADLPTQKLQISQRAESPEKTKSPEKRTKSPEKRTKSPEKRSETIPQKKESLPQKKAAGVAQKRQSTQDDAGAPKRQRLSGVATSRSLRQLRDSQREQDIVEKENIPDNRQTMPPVEIIDEQMLIPEIEIQPASDPEKRLTSMLQAAGLADMEMRPVVPHIEEESQRKSRRGGSESSETMLGSLDRTKVSLGDSEQTTDSKRFIRDQWGTEGTMVKVLRAIKADLPSISIEALVARGPVLPGRRRLIAARCFNSILKLKQHGFIKVHKDPETLEVTDILLGPKFDY